jgi:hypothetical protein
MADESKAGKTAAAKSKSGKAKASKTAGAKAPARKSRANAPKRAEGTSIRTTEKAGVGTATTPEKVAIPDEVKIKRDNVGPEPGAKISTQGPEVQGDQALQIIDNTMSRPVHVSLIEGKALTPDTDGRLIFVQGPVSNDLMPIAAARSKFAVKKDGTAIYNARGFDDVVTGEFDLLDIEKLIEHNHRKGKSRK